MTKTDGSVFVLKFVETLMQLKIATNLIEFLTKLTGQISGQALGSYMSTQTPQFDVFPHLGTSIICNTEKYL